MKHQAGHSKDRADELLDAVLDYARCGWGVFPVYEVRDGKCACGAANCSHPGKHPRARHGVKDATTDERVIRTWWRRWPNANIGIATGRHSGLVVVDIDPRNGGDKNLEILEDRHGRLPRTLEVISGGGGRHLYFRVPRTGPPIRTVPTLDGLSGLELKADGGLIVAPPSRHQTGRRYRWHE